MKILQCEDTKEWENWLVNNNNTQTGIWLVFYKKRTKRKGISYEDSVRIALCYGWIDSLIKKLDEDRYAQKFTPRKPKSNWSESNKKRVTELIKEGLMQPAGMRLVQIAKQNGNWNKAIRPPKINTTIPHEFKIAMDKNHQAKAFFNSLTKSKQKDFIVWIVTAKREKTRFNRIEESIRLLTQNKHLGLK